MVDVLIAGGAVMGASVAFWLKRLDPALDIEVVEPDPTYATSSTALAASGIRMQFSDPVNVEISRFGVDFIRDFARWTGPEGGVPDLGLRENGYLFLTGTETGAAQLESLAAMQRGLGAATEVLDRAELAARFPWMQLDDIMAGAFGPRDEGFFDNMGLLSGLKNAARAAGAVGEVVNLGSDFEVSVGDTARLIAEVMGVSAEIVSDAERLRPDASEVQRLWADTRKAAALLEWQPAYGGLEGFKRGLAETVAWFTRAENLTRYRPDVYNL